MLLNSHQDQVSFCGPTRYISCLDCLEGEGAGQGQLPAPDRGEAHWYDEAPYKIHPSRNPELGTQSTGQAYRFG